MAYTLGNKYAKNLYKRIVLLQLIIENVVTCFFWNTVYRVAQKNGASVFHCKYFENSTTNLRGSW